MANNDFALVVGITNYPRIRPLGGPENDAQHFYNWLISTDADKGQLPEENVFKVWTSLYPESDPDWPDPTQERIERALTQLLRSAEKYIDTTGEQGNRLYLFFAGHGMSRGLNGVALLTANADYESMVGYYIDGPVYADWFVRAAYFKEVVLLMDCCRDDRPAIPERQPPWPEKKDTFAGDVRTFYGYATKVDYQSREKEIPPGSGTTQGIFTRTLLDGLENAEADAAGYITGMALKKYIYAKLPQLAGPDLQEPRIMLDDMRDIKWAFKGKTVQNQVEIRLEPPAPGTVIIEDPDLKEIGTFPADQPIQLEKLAVGIYNVRWPATGKAQGFDIVDSDKKITVTVAPDAAPEARVIYA